MPNWAQRATLALLVVTFHLFSSISSAEANESWAISNPDFKFAFSPYENRVVVAYRSYVKANFRQVLAAIHSNKYDSDLAAVFGPNPVRLIQESIQFSENKLEVDQTLALVGDDGALERAKQVITYDGALLTVFLYEIDSNNTDVPANPFAGRSIASLDAPTEGGLCNCLSDVEMPITNFLKSLKNLVSAKCDQKQKSTFLTYLTAESSCVRGAATSVVQLVNGTYTVLKFLLNTSADSNYRLSLETKAATLAWTAVRHPIDITLALYRVVRNAVTKAYTNFKTCGPSYQVATVCKILTNLFLPGGILFKALKKWRLARAAANVGEALGVAARASSAARVSTAIEDVVGEKTNLEAVISTSTENSLEAAKADSVHLKTVDNRSLQAAVKDVVRSDFDLAEERTPVAFRRKQNLAKAMSAPESKAEAAMKVTYKTFADNNLHFPMLFAKSKKYVETSRKLGSEMEEFLKQKGLNPELIWKNKRRATLQLELNKMSAKLAHSSHRHIEMLTDEIKQESQKGNYDFMAYIDLNSTPMLRQLRDKWGLEYLKVDSSISDLGEYRNGCITLNPSTIVESRGNLELNSAFLHEVHHLVNARRLERGVSGPMYAVYRNNLADAASTGSYSAHMDFDEMPAWRRSIKYNELGLQQAAPSIFLKNTNRALRAVRAAREALEAGYFKPTGEKSNIFKIDLSPNHSEVETLTIPLTVRAFKPENSKLLLGVELDRLEAKLLYYQKVATETVSKSPSSFADH